MIRQAKKLVLGGLERVMRRKRRMGKKLLLIAVLLMLCVAAAAYLLKTVGDMKAQREAAQAEETAAAEQQAAEEAAAQEAAAKKYDSIYAYSGTKDKGKYTLAAYDSAVEAGCGAIVLPFVVSQDGTLIVADDDFAQDLTGYSGYFSGMTDGQIENLQTKSGDKILKLSDVFDKYGRDVHYIIEVKYTSARNLMALKELIEKKDYADVVSISSEYFSGLRTLDNEFPNTPKIFLCSGEEGWAEALNSDYIDAISVSKDLMSDERCKAVQDKKKKFGAGILSSEEDIKKAKEMGADFYFTDEAALAAGIE